MTHAAPSYETKHASSDAQAFEDLHRAFEAFRETNDQRLGELETRLSADVLVDEKLARIDQVLDEARRRVDSIALKASRPPLGAATSARPRPAPPPSTRPPSTSMSGPARAPG